MSSIFAVSDTWFNRLLEDDQNLNVVDNNEHIIDTWNERVRAFRQGTPKTKEAF